MSLPTSITMKESKESHEDEVMKRCFGLTIVNALVIAIVFIILAIFSLISYIIYINDFNNEDWNLSSGDTVVI